MTIIKKDAEPRRPPEFRAELTRLNAEDLASSSSNSSDNEDAEKSPKTKKVTLKDLPTGLPTGLPPNGKSLSRNGSKEENLLNGKLNGDNKTTQNGRSSRHNSPIKQSRDTTPNGSLDRCLQHATPFLQVRCLASSDKCSVSNKPPVPFVFSGPKRSVHIRDLKLECEVGKFPFQLSGGAEYGQLLWIGAILHPDLLSKLQVGDILLSANKFANNALELEVISSNYVPIEIAKIFADKRWINLHVVIRDNALLHTCQYTTRPPQEGETPGHDYNFVSIQEFNSLVRRDFFLEWTENSDG
ncbi:Membrane-associated guanylate kinase, WW and PDZ domain-containing protein 1 isoform X18 [Aphelenchoides bicaudatus]|nr:Membrane-associated guanylate kinase, WW and PDZ domain-containing protein 1 isoform X18 [Aphelenchoides bicaudatus]